MTEETTPKPVTEKVEETASKQPVENSDQSPPKPIAEKPMETIKKTAEKSPEVIFIGNKPPMSYVMAIITAVSAGSITEVMLKARGRAITTAVDVAEIARNRFIKDLTVKSISIGTEEMPPREGENKSRMVSTIEIELTKK